MKVARWTLLLLLPVSLSATEIPPDLQARSDALARTAPHAVLSWAHEEAGKLAKATGPVDVRALEATIRARFGAEAHAETRIYKNLGSLGDADVSALMIIVMIEAAKSAREDLKAILDGVKAINKRRVETEAVHQRVDRYRALAATPTPVPDRVSVLVAAARNVSGNARSTSLAHVRVRR